MTGTLVSQGMIEMLSNGVYTVGNNTLGDKEDRSGI